MGSPMFTAVLLVVLISACLSDDATTITTEKVEISTAITLSNTSNIESATVESTTNSSNTSKPSKSGDNVKTQKPSALDSGVYTRAFCVLVALGGLVIIYLGVKAFWRTRRARAAAAQNKSSTSVAATGRRPAAGTTRSDRSALIASDEEEDEESTVFDQSRERLLKASARKS